MRYSKIKDGLGKSRIWEADNILTCVLYMSVGFHKGVYMVKNTKIFLSKVMGQRVYLLLRLFKSIRIITPKCLCNSVFLLSYG